MQHGSHFWVIGGEFGSMNFHKLVEGSAQVQGPFKTRKEAEDAWRAVSEENPPRQRALLDRGRAAPRHGLISGFRNNNVQGKAASSGRPGGAVFLCRPGRRRKGAQAFDNKQPLLGVWLLID